MSTATNATDLDAPIQQPCNRCGGSGRHGPTCVERGVCFECGGRGKSGKIVTQRILDARAARAAKRLASRHAEDARIRAKGEAVLAADPELAAAAKTDHHIVGDIVARLMGRGEISDKQRNLVVQIAADVAERTAAKAEREASLTELDAGRYELVGEVVSTKLQTSAYGTTLKMLVQLDNGNRVFGSVPKDLDFGVGIQGRRVAFLARVQPKEIGFGFFSRPAKARFV